MWILQVKSKVKHLENIVRSKYPNCKDKFIEQLFLSMYKSEIYSAITMFGISAVLFSLKYKFLSGCMSSAFECQPPISSRFII